MRGFDADSSEQGGDRCNQLVRLAIILHCTGAAFIDRGEDIYLFL